MEKKKKKTFPEKINRDSNFSRNRAALVSSYVFHMNVILLDICFEVGTKHALQPTYFLEENNG